MTAVVWVPVTVGPVFQVCDPVSEIVSDGAGLPCPMDTIATTSDPAGGENEPDAGVVTVRVPEATVPVFAPGVEASWEIAIRSPRLPGYLRSRLELRRGSVQPKDAIAVHLVSLFDEELVPHSAASSM